MTTAEQLFVSIFWSKNRIIQQVKHQTELYNNHLASKALRLGLTPPSFLFNPNNSLPKELSKEDLISELLPRGNCTSRAPVRYSVAGSSSQYNRPFTTEFREAADGFGTEAHASSKDGNDVVAGSTIVEGHECIGQDASNYLPEPDVSSPVDVVDVRISNIYTDPDLSLARIQRSKSRQKAIEQRNSATSQAKGTPRDFSGNRLFALDHEQTSHINNSNILSEPCATSGAKQPTFRLRNENNIGASSNEIKFTVLEPEQVHTVNEPPRSVEPFSISSESCRVKGKSETHNENVGARYSDHAGPVAVSKRSGNSCSLEKPTPKNSKAGDKESNIFNKCDATSRDIVEIDGGIGSSKGNGHSNEKGVISHAERSPRSKSSGKSCEDTASKKEESRIEEKGSDAYIEKSSTLDIPAQQENRSSDFIEENCFSGFVLGKDVDNINSGNDPKSSNNQICSFDVLLEHSSPENKSGNRIIPRHALQEVSDIRESVLEDGKQQNDIDPKFLKLSSLSKVSLPDENSSIQTMGAGTNEELFCDSTQQLFDNEFSVTVREADRRSEDSPLNSQTLKAASNGSADRSFARFQGSDREKSMYEDSQFQRASGDHVLLPLSDTCDKADQLESVNKIEAIEPGTEKLAETFHVSDADELREKSLGNSCSPLPHAAAAVPRNSFTSNKEGDSGVQMAKSEPRKGWHYELEARQNSGQLSPSNEAASTPSSLLDIIADVKFSSEQGCGSSSELLVEGGSAGEKSIYGDSQFQGASGDLVLPFSDLCDNAEQLESVNTIEAIEPGSSKLAETSHVSVEDERGKKSLGNSCILFPDAAADVPRDSFTSDKAGDSGVQMSKSEPRRSCHYELEARQNNGQHSPSTEAASIRSNPSDTINDVKFSSEQGCESSSELLMEQGFAAEKSIYEDRQFQRASGDLAMLPIFDMCDKSVHLESLNKIEAIEPGTVTLEETLHVSEEVEQREKSLGNSCSPFPDAAADVPRYSFPSNEAGDSGVQIAKSEPRRSWHYELEAHQNIGRHSPSNEGASTRSNPLNTIDDVKFSSGHGCESSSELLLEEEKHYPTKNYESIGNHSRKKSEASISPRRTEIVAESTLGGLFEVTNPSYLSTVYATNHIDETKSDIKSDDYPLGISKLSSEKISSEGRLPLQVDGHQPQHSDPSPLNKDLKLMIDDWGNLPESFIEEGYSKRKSVVEDGILSHSVQPSHMEEFCAKDAESLPELESFLVDSQSENDTGDLPSHITNFDNFELPRSTIARVSMLERLCKSASAYTPLSHISSAFKIDKVPDMFHSVSNGLLEHSDLGGVHFQNEVNESGASLSKPSEAEGGFQGVPLTHSLPCSGAPIGFSTVNGFSSPEGRFWEGYPSRSSSSGKRLSSNPEFECFTIKEDSCISEENESADDDCDKLPKDVGSLPANCHAIDSDKFVEDSDSLTVHCAAREPSTGIHNKFKSFLRSSHKKKGMGKDSQTPLHVASGKRMAKESLNNRFKKMKTSGKSSWRNEHLNLAREPYGSNIVSNVTSFVPLVQQKQAAAKACPVRREIKVKALEAAEAAKRLEEKRENERNLKKEALKKERARTLEQEKAKQIELIKKKKEDEQRRKDADMVLRKRLREEEERKEERKRTRTEETRRKQREQEEKLHAKKAGNMNSKKKSNHELKPQQMKKQGEHAKLDNKSGSAACSIGEIQQASSTCPKECSYSADLYDNKQANCTPDKAKTSNFIRDSIQEKSYEISPFQWSDEEDDEDDELHTKKFIPSWASKNLVAESLSVMREVDPSVIFPPESRCSMDEVLLPRTQQKV